MALQIDTTHRSPNHDSRHGHAVELIVLHATVGSYESALSWLCNPGSKVSTHYLIRKDGYIARLVDESEQAWHAGVSVWRGRYDCNLFSIGIELENANTGRDPYPLAQLDALQALVADILHRYQLGPDAIATHAQIAVPAGRKSDPAGFPLAVFLGRLNAPDVPRWRVKDAATAGATIRLGVSQAAKRVGVLRPGEEWRGDVQPGQQVSITGFGSSALWVVAPDGRAVWSGLLEKVSA